MLLESQDLQRDLRTATSHRAVLSCVSKRQRYWRGDNIIRDGATCSPGVSSTRGPPDESHVHLLNYLRRPISPVNRIHTRGLINLPQRESNLARNLLESAPAILRDSPLVHGTKAILKEYTLRSRYTSLRYSSARYRYSLCGLRLD